MFGDVISKFSTFADLPFSLKIAEELEIYCGRVGPNGMKLWKNNSITLYQNSRPSYPHGRKWIKQEKHFVFVCFNNYKQCLRKRNSVRTVQMLDAIDSR